jgi:hypothetical protein
VDRSILISLRYDNIVRILIVNTEDDSVPVWLIAETGAF